MKTFDIAKILNAPKLPLYIKEVEKQLNIVVGSEYSIISEPIQRLVNANSKRLRPSMLIAIVANKLNKIDKKVITSCVAVELVHIASLVHDDIIDHASTRWGVPTINAKEGIYYAVMIGDYLFSKANQQAALVDANVAGIIAKAIEDLCVGEMIEMADEFNLNRTIKSLVRTIEGKTAALISSCCSIGGICSGLDKSELASLTSFGKYFGMSFQFVDDLLDFMSNEQLLGKPVGNDVKEGIYNTPIILSLSGNNATNTGKLINKKSEIDNNLLVDNLIKDGSIEKSIMLIHEYNKQAVNNLDKIKDNQIKDSLSKLPSAYMNWALNNLVEPRYKKLITTTLTKLN